MVHASPPRVVGLPKASEDTSWRSRTRLACGLAAVGLVAAAASRLDWSEGAAMALGQLAGIVAPLAVLGLAVWAVAVATGRKS